MYKMRAVWTKMSWLCYLFERGVIMKKNIKLLQGNEACVHGAIYAGMNFFAGYPI